MKSLVCLYLCCFFIEKYQCTFNSKLNFLKKNRSCLKTSMEHRYKDRGRCILVGLLVTNGSKQDYSMIYTNMYMLCQRLSFTGVRILNPEWVTCS